MAATAIIDAIARLTAVVPVTRATVVRIGRKLTSSEYSAPSRLPVIRHGRLSNRPMNLSSNEHKQHEIGRLTLRRLRPRPCLHSEHSQSCSLMEACRLTNSDGVRTTLRNN